MSHTLMVVANEAEVGKTVFALGLLDQLERHGARARYFKPVGGTSREVRPAPGSHPHVFEPTVAVTAEEVTTAIHEGRYEEVMDRILEVHARLLASADVVVCEGLDSVRAFPSLDSDINVDMAKSMDASILLVVAGGDRTADEIAEIASVHRRQLTERGVDVLGVIVNRVPLRRHGEVCDGLRRHLRREGITLYGALPELNLLSHPTVGAVARAIGAEVVDGRERIDAQVGNVLVAAMGLENALHYFGKDSLLITPGDREEILLAAAAACVSEHTPRPSGIVLTGGFEPRRKVMQMARDLTGGRLPILRVDTPTYETAIAVHGVHPEVDLFQEDKLTAIREAMEEYVDTELLVGRRIEPGHRVVTPRRFLRMLRDRARSDKKTIVLPESDVPRILQATAELRRHDLVDIVLLGDPADVERRARQVGVTLDAGVTIVNPRDDAEFDDYVRTLVELRKHKNVPEQMARDLMVDRNYFGTMMVYKGRADGMVSGSTTTTQATIRPAFEFVRTQPGISSVSSVFFMCLPDRVLVYGDCAVIPKPTTEQLAEIALASAETARAFGIEPRVAMLSYSTGESGKGAEVDTVREATEIVRRRAPDLFVEGPIQYDAAIDPVVAATKLPDSDVAGKATVLIFPDLNTGNNTYKAVQRSAGAIAIGPVLQGLNKPVNDLSRGATVADIVNTVIVTAIQAQALARKG
jgi:phosphate acetyltransferase